MPRKPSGALLITLVWSQYDGWGIAYKGAAPPPSVALLRSGTAGDDKRPPLVTLPLSSQGDQGEDHIWQGHSVYGAVGLSRVATVKLD